MQVEEITSRLRSRIGAVASLLGRQTTQARQMLRKVLADKSELETDPAASAATSSGEPLGKTHRGRGDE